MNVDLMRAEIAKAYDGANWKKKVKRMPDKQVIAVYYSFRDKEYKKKEIQEKELLERPQQLSFEDIFKEFEVTNQPTNNIFEKATTIRMPYADTMMGDYTVCPREVLLKGWSDMVGKFIDFNKRMRKVERVKVEDGFIFIDLE